MVLGLTTLIFLSLIVGIPVIIGIVVVVVLASASRKGELDPDEHLLPPAAPAPTDPSAPADTDEWPT